VLKYYFRGIVGPNLFALDVDLREAGIATDDSVLEKL
jgi:hypothetical protein